MASAIGASLPVQEAGGNFIVDIGGGTTEVAVISLGGIVLSKSLRIAGDKLNEDIIHFAQEEYKLLIGERTAEMIKISIGSAHPLKEKKEIPMRGRNLVTGLPEEVLISDKEVRRAMEKSVRRIISEIKTAIEETPGIKPVYVYQLYVPLGWEGSEIKWDISYLGRSLSWGDLERAQISN